MKSDERRSNSRLIEIALLAGLVTVLVLLVAPWHEKPNSESSQEESTRESEAVDQVAATIPFDPTPAAETPPVLPDKPGPSPRAVQEPAGQAGPSGGASSDGASIELVYSDSTALKRAARAYGFEVLAQGDPTPSGDWVGYIDCGGFRLAFDRSVYEHMDREIGPLRGLRSGTRLVVEFRGHRLVRRG